MQTAINPRVAPAWWIFGGAPAAVGRATQASWFLLNTLSEVRRRYPHGAGIDDALGRARWLSRIGQRLCDLHRVRVNRSGSPPSGPFVLVANHVSYVDPVSICSTIACSAISKREIADWPVIGETLRALGVLMVARESVANGAMVLRQAMAKLRAGVPVLAFPEGTTTYGDDVLPLRRGMFGVARILNVPIVPLAIRYDRRDMAWTGNAPFMPHYVRTAAWPSTDVWFHFGAPIDPLSEDSAQALAAVTRERLRELLKATDLSAVA